MLAAGVAALLYFLFAGAPARQTLAYDLGEEREALVRLEVNLWHEDEHLGSAAWAFDPGEAPRRVSHSIRLPRDDIEVRLRRWDVDGALREERRVVDAADPADRVLHLE